MKTNKEKDKEKQEIMNERACETCKLQRNCRRIMRYSGVCIEWVKR